MTAGIIVIALLVLGALAWVVLPLFGGERDQVDPRAAGLGLARELHSRHQQLLASLRDLEDDRATDKIDDADYQDLRNRLSAEAIEVMRELDTLKDERDAATEVARKAAEPLRHPGARRSGPRA